MKHLGTQQWHETQALVNENINHNAKCIWGEWKLEPK